METDRIVTPIEVRWFCDNCLRKGDVGYMYFTEDVKHKYYGDQYEHKCGTCGEVIWFEKQYPYIKYEPLHAD